MKTLKSTYWNRVFFIEILKRMFNCIIHELIWHHLKMKIYMILILIFIFVLLKRNQSICIRSIVDSNVIQIWINVLFIVYFFAIRCLIIFTNQNWIVDHYIFRVINLLRFYQRNNESMWIVFTFRKKFFSLMNRCSRHCQFMTCLINVKKNYICDKFDRDFHFFKRKRIAFNRRIEKTIEFRRIHFVNSLQQINFYHQY